MKKMTRRFLRIFETNRVVLRATVALALSYVYDKTIQPYMIKRFS